MGSAGMWRDYSFHGVVRAGLTEVIVEQRSGGGEGASFRCHRHHCVDIITVLVLLGKALCKWYRLSWERRNKQQPLFLASWTDMSPEKRCWPLSQVILHPSVGEEKPRDPTPILFGKKGILFPGHATLRCLDLSEGPKQVAPKIPRVWSLIFSLTMGTKTKSSFLRQLDKYVIIPDNWS